MWEFADLCAGAFFLFGLTCPESWNLIERTSTTFFVVTFSSPKQTLFDSLETRKNRQQKCTHKKSFPLSHELFVRGWKVFLGFRILCICQQNNIQSGFKFFECFGKFYQNSLALGGEVFQLEALGKFRKKNSLSHLPNGNETSLSFSERFSHFH